MQFLGRSMDGVLSKLVMGGKSRELARLQNGSDYFILKLDREINYLRYMFFKAPLLHEETCPNCKK